ncbi:unnamed protein product [Rotaria socialis]|uniref:F-box domain-containing protein n=2 Tax=Rotaria socialis TaxID=392032 RepID=A0A818RVK0_9BILA|nr:unnamed protein product [Rotaria socialis]
MTTEVSSHFFLGLPIEIIYQVLDELDILQILYSLCNVCPRLNMIIGTYYRYKTLVTLDLTGNKLGAREAQCLADALKTNTTLTTLYLGSNGIGYRGATYLADALETNKALTTLHLGSNDIGPSGALYLSYALEKNKTLTALHLESNGIGSDGAQHLADELENNKLILRKFSRLTKLSIEMMHYSDTSDDESLLNGFQWEQLISTYLPTLNVLKFRISISKEQLNAQLMGSFQTEFWIQHKWFVDFDVGILYTTTYTKRELTLWCTRNISSLLSGVSNRYDHVETLVVNFSTDFQWSAEALSSFPEDYYEYDRRGMRCGFVHDQLKPDEYQSVCIFLNKILRLSKLQSLAIYSFLPKDYLIQLLSSPTNLTKLELHGWAGDVPNRI